MNGMTGVELSYAELDVIGQALNLDVRRYPFTFPSFGVALAERAQLISQVAAGLAARRLTRGDQLSPDITVPLRLFATGTLSVAMLGMAGDKVLCGAAVTDGRGAVLAMQSGESITFESISVDGMARALITQLPAAPPARGGSTTVTATLPRGASPTHGGSARGASPTQRELTGDTLAATRILERPRLGTGTFLITTQGRAGRPGSEATLAWVDNDAGRYAVISDKAPDGRVHITYAPADQRKLDQLLTRLINNFR
jgi:hypothetical protein